MYPGPRVYTNQVVRTMAETGKKNHHSTKKRFYKLWNNFRKMFLKIKLQCLRISKEQTVCEHDQQWWWWWSTTSPLGSFKMNWGEVENLFTGQMNWNCFLENMVTTSSGLSRGTFLVVNSTDAVDTVAWRKRCRWEATERNWFWIFVGEISFLCCLGSALQTGWALQSGDGGGKWIDGRSSDPSWRSTPAAVSCSIARRFFRLILKTATTAAGPVSHSLEKRQHGKGHR